MRLLLLLLCSALPAQVQAYGKGCDNFNVYSMWAPVEGHPMEFLLYPQGPHNLGDTLILGLGFYPNNYQLNWRCKLLIYPSIHMFCKVQDVGYGKVLVARKIPKGFKGIRLYFQGFYPRYKTTTGGLKVTVQ